MPLRCSGKAESMVWDGIQMEPFFWGASWQKHSKQLIYSSNLGPSEFPTQSTRKNTQKRCGISDGVFLMIWSVGTVRKLIKKRSHLAQSSLLSTPNSFFIRCIPMKNTRETKGAFFIISGYIFWKYVFIGISLVLRWVCEFLHSVDTGTCESRSELMLHRWSILAILDVFYPTLTWPNLALRSNFLARFFKTASTHRDTPIARVFVQYI